MDFVVCGLDWRIWRLCSRRTDRDGIPQSPAGLHATQRCRAGRRVASPAAAWQRPLGKGMPMSDRSLPRPMWRASGTHGHALAKRWQLRPLTAARAAPPVSVPPVRDPVSNSRIAQ